MSTRATPHASGHSPTSQGLVSARAPKGGAAVELRLVPGCYQQGLGILKIRGPLWGFRAYAKGGLYRGYIGFRV